MLRARVISDPNAVKKMVARRQRESLKRADEIARLVGARTVQYLRGYTSETKQPEPVTDEDARRIRKRFEERYAEGLSSSDEKRRKAAREFVRKEVRKNLHRLKRQRFRRAKRRFHPGHWGDVSGNLAKSFRFEIHRNPNSVELWIINDANHAHLLEARDGFFVVQGVFEDDRVWQIMMVAAKEVAPEWEIRRSR